jgi:hypothetical protein
MNITVILLHPVLLEVYTVKICLDLSFEGLKNTFVTRRDRLKVDYGYSEA